MRKIIFSIAAMIVFAFSAAEASDDVSICITPNRTAARAGEEIVYTVRLNNADGAAEIQMAVEYNTEMLEFKKGKALAKSDLYSAKADKNKPQVNFIQIPKEAITESTDIATLTFAVKEGATGECAVRAVNITVGSGSDELSQIPFDSENSGSVYLVGNGFSCAAVARKTESGDVYCDVYSADGSGAALVFAAFYEKDRFIGGTEPIPYQITADSKREIYLGECAGGADSAKIMLWSANDLVPLALFDTVE